MNGDEQLRGRRMRGRHLDRAIRHGDGDHAQEGRGVNSFAATWQVQGVNTHPPDTHRPHQRADCP
jgi:phage-related protein